MTKDMKAIILGGTMAHAELIKKLKDLGYFTILIDYYQNPPAKKYADEHIKESTLDKEKVLEIAKIKNVDLVISTSIDQANVTACWVQEKLGKKPPYSYETSLKVTNKPLMKKIMFENNIPTSNFIVVKKLEDIENHKLNYPLIIKPSDSSGSKGVNKVYNKKEMISNIKNALEISRSNEAIVEEFMEGKEVSMDCLIKDNEVHILTIRESKKIDIKNNSLQQIWGTFYPAEISNNVYRKIQNIAKKISDVFNLDNTPLLIQAIIKEEKIFVIEFAPRIGGGENYRFIKLVTGFDILDASINSFLNEEINLYYENSNKYYSDIMLYAEECIFDRIDNYESLKNQNIIEYLVSYKSKGDIISREITSSNRVGAFVSKGETKKDLIRKIKLAIETLKIYDKNGKNVIKKNIYDLGD